MPKIDNVDSTLEQLKRWYNARKTPGDTSVFDLKEQLLMRSTKSASNSSRLAHARQIMRFYSAPWLESLRNARDPQARMNELSDVNGGELRLFDVTLSKSLREKTDALGYFLDANPYSEKEPATREVIAAHVDDIIIELGEMGYLYHLWDQLEGLYPRTDLNDS